MQENLNGWSIWQNKGFGRIYANSLDRDVLFANSIQIFASKKPIINYMSASIHIPSMRYNKFLEINKFCEEKRFIMLTINSYEEIDGLDEYLKDDTRGTYLLDLGLDEDDLWGNLNKKNRNLVRKGRKNGVYVKIVKDEIEFNTWYEIYKNTGVVKTFTVQPYQLVKNLFRSNYSKLFCAYKDDTMLSGAFIVHDDKCMMYWLGGFDREYARYSPNNLLQWEIMMYGKKNGYLVYDMGGAFGKVQSSVSGFKKSFGGKYITLYTYKIYFNNLKSKFWRSEFASVGINLYRKLKQMKLF